MKKEEQRMIYDYFSAFAALYGIVPLYRALRIIRKQNPQLEMTDEEFLTLCEDEEHWEFYIIVGQEEIYEGVPPTPPLKREIIAEDLYMDDFEDYEEMKSQHSDKPWYVPEKEKLLLYADPGYIEETRQYAALKNFLSDEIGLKDAEEIAENLELTAQMGDGNAEDAVSALDFGKNHSRHFTMEQMKRFLHLYFELFNHTRLRENRGFTPVELAVRMGKNSLPPWELL